MSIKNFLINEQQLQAVFGILLEFPGKAILGAVDILRNLPVHLAVEQDKPDSEKPE